MNNKKLTIMLLLILIVVILSACSNKKTEIKEKELVFVGKEEIVNKFVGTFYYLYFESTEDKKYYYVSVSGWEYDNFKTKENETIKLNHKEDSSLHGQVEVFDEYKKLRVSDKSMSK